MYSADSHRQDNYFTADIDVEMDGLLDTDGKDAFNAYLVAN
jgi:hypothetical protein